MRILLILLSITAVIFLILTWGDVTKPESTPPIVTVIQQDQELDQDEIRLEEAFAQFSRAWDLNCSAKTGADIQIDGLIVDKELAETNLKRAADKFNALAEKSGDNLFAKQLQQQQLNAECNGE